MSQNGMGVLQGTWTRLEPLTLEHEEALIRATSEGELWRLTYTVVPSRDTMRAYIEQALESQRLGQQEPFAIIDRRSETVVGSTRYDQFHQEFRKREIGWTWLALSSQRT
jgi:RimJ/RimL family protein N-acetyltransferase